MATEQIRQESDLPLPDETSSRYAWIALLALLTLIGLVVWLVVSNGEDAV